LAARRLAWRRALAGSGRLVAVSAAVSLWWVAMLAIQSRYGADVLAYSETLESVSFTATSSEVARGLGYWLFYIRDAFAPATSSSGPYQEHPALIVVGFLLTASGALGLVTTSWRHRPFALALLACGFFLAVGVHPYDDPSPLMHLVRDSSLGLALR